MEAIKVYPTPKNARDFRAFIGLASFYRRLVPNFAEIAKPLTALTRKNQEFVWGQTQQDAFDCLKQKLSTTRAGIPEFWSAIHSDDRRIQRGYCGCCRKSKMESNGPLLSQADKRTRPNSLTRRLSQRCSHWFGQPSFSVVISMVVSSLPGPTIQPSLTCVIFQTKIRGSCGGA